MIHVALAGGVLAKTFKDLLGAAFLERSGSYRGVKAVPYYRLYHLKENRFVGVDDFEAQDDVQALHNAKSLNGTAVSELWEGGRKIVTLQPDEGPA